MKAIFISLGVIALATVVRAEPLDANTPRRGKNAQQQSSTQTQQQVVTPKVHAQIRGKGNGQLNTNTQLNTQQNFSRARFHKFDQDGAGNAQANIRAGRVRRFELNQRNVEKIEKVKFRNENHIVGAEKWQGQKYAAFRNYRAQWHDRNWWRNHHNRIIIVFGAPYYWDAGWWYPAWGYDPYANYYYDGPIYAYNDLPPDQVVANVQASLQEQGYYEGEIDGVLGPLTRAAIAAYQQDHGLYVTSAIDEPTLEELGMT